MNKTAILCAAALVAFGLSARADEAVGATQVIITIPVVRGENCIGVCVDSETPSAMLDDVFTIAESATVHTPEEYQAGSVGAAPGTAFFYAVDEDGVIYQKGVVATGNTIVVAAKTLTMVASPKAAAWRLSDVTALETGSYKMPTDKANWVYIWDTDGKAYRKYWFDSARSGWKLYGSSTVLTGDDVPVVQAGQGVYVKLGAAATLTFPE